MRDPSLFKSEGGDSGDNYCPLKKRGRFCVAAVYALLSLQIRREKTIYGKSVVVILGGMAALLVKYGIDKSEAEVVEEKPGGGGFPRRNTASSARFVERTDAEYRISQSI
ncbi:MAG: hypothetical protein P1U34_05195 [Coxiellaceae bacterium]|nr:hypothetical protein [Coxiellaceae bacterium]